MTYCYLIQPYHCIQYTNGCFGGRGVGSSHKRNETHVVLTGYTWSGLCLSQFDRHYCVPLMPIKVNIERLSPT